MFYVDKVDDKTGSQPHRNTNVVVAIIKQLFQFCIVNGWAQWKVQNKEDITLIDFQKKVVLGFLKDQQTIGFPIQQNTIKNHELVKKKHDIKLTFVRDTYHELGNIVNNEKPKGTCDTCRIANSRTPYICTFCSTLKNPVFIHQNCFLLHIDEMKKEKVDFK